MASSGSPQAQLQTSNNALAEFYEGLVSSVNNASALPKFSEYLSRLEYDELLRRATQDANGTADPATAIAVEEVHNNAAHIREHVMATKSKVQLYLGVTNEYQQSADYHKDRAVLFAKLLSGETRVGYLQ